MPRRIYRKKRRGGYVGYRRRLFRAGYLGKEAITKAGKTSYANRYSMIAYPYDPPRGISYNPQFLKVKRSFQMSGPVADPASSWKYVDITGNSSAVGTTLYYPVNISFSIKDIPSVTEFGNLFDQYRIVGIKLTFKYMNATDVNTSYINLNMPLCTLCLVNDYDDNNVIASTPAGWQSITETGRYKLKTFPNNKSNSMSIYVKPKVKIAVLDTSGTQVSRLVTGRQWLDGVTALDAEFFGVKGLLQTNPTTIGVIEHKIRVYATYYTQWRQRQ